ncbi:hypothetical protein APUTEX25_000731 [Auxenochlorella protothecoides]|uniref:Uncharacterized protein n=1 Tax=Auxenochlorella protothecoides TaxID=3075 RepID=A0A3M7KTA4_AUXPR|nr:hypothetical protein APUTEX25_000731 [Auxenochlorella protothecoides]|eukprot:RMZ52612.1 hypothetical protein APUTEX25_000731 [Auxenochlorella protothecoides]
MSLPTSSLDRDLAGRETGATSPSPGPVDVPVLRAPPGKTLLPQDAFPNGLPPALPRAALQVHPLALQRKARHPPGPSTCSAATSTSNSLSGGGSSLGLGRGPLSSSESPCAPGVSSPVSTADIQLVQNLIERCLQVYLAQGEVVKILSAQATIEPGFTQLVWQKLEEQNPDFFAAYNLRLKLKGQIIMFNHLLEQQVQVVQRMQHGWVPTQQAQQFGAGRLGSGGSGPTTSATASGIPLFQSGPLHSGGPGREGGGLASGLGDTDTRSANGFLYPNLGPSLLESGAQAQVPLFPGMRLCPSEPDLVSALAQVGMAGGICCECLDSVRPLGAQLAPLLPLPPLLIQNPLSILGHTGHAGGGGADLSMPPRNFSLSDLTLDQLHADGLDMDMQ